MNKGDKLPRPVGLIAAAACFLLFLPLAAISGYGGQFFFWTGAVSSPLVGGIVSLFKRMHFRPIVIVCVAAGVVVAIPVFGYAIFRFAFL